MFYDLQTNRLNLKLISFNDKEFIFSQFSDDIVNRYLFDSEPLTDINGAEEIINYYVNSEPITQCRWILVRKSDNKKMGTCGFHRWDKKNGIVEIGYDLKPNYWGQGYMQEALNVIISYAFNFMGIKKINACIYIDNKKSISLAEKLEFSFQGQTKDEIFRGNKYPHKIYSLALR